MGLTDVEVPVWKVTAVIVAVSLLSGAAGAVAISALNLNPIAAGAGQLTASSDISVDSQDLVYEGNNVTAVDVTISNSDIVNDHTVDVNFALRDSTETAIATQTFTNQTIPANGTTTITVTLSSTPGVDEFRDVEVTVEQTG